MSMNSGGAGSSAGNARIPPYSLSTADGTLTVGSGSDAEIIDLSEVGALEQLIALLGPEAETILEDIKAQMRRAGYELRGDRFVPNDTFEVSNAPAGDDGPPPVDPDNPEDEALSEMEQELEREGVVLSSGSLRNLYRSANNSPEASTVRGSPEFNEVLNRLNAAIANPTPGNTQAFYDYLQEVAANSPFGDVINYVMLVMKESVAESYEDKKYWLKRIQFFNKVSEALNEQADLVAKMSAQLSHLENSADYPEKAFIEVGELEGTGDLERYDPHYGDEEGNPVGIGVELTTTQRKGDPAGAEMKDENGEHLYGDDQPRTVVTRDDIDLRAKSIEREQETVRNERQMAMTHFQNFDSKSNQAINILTAAIKHKRDVNLGTTRNIL